MLDKIQQHEGATAKSVASLGTNVTSSIIQDYVPETYTNEQLLHDMPESRSSNEHPYLGDLEPARRDERPTVPLPTGEVMPGRRVYDSVRDPTNRTDGAAQQTTEAGEMPSFSSEYGDKANQEGGVSGDEGYDLNAGLLNWPSPKQGHGYAAKRVQKPKGQGPAPFLTPGPHRHKLVTSPTQE